MGLNPSKGLSCGLAAGLVLLGCFQTLRAQTSQERFERQLREFNEDVYQLVHPEVPLEQRALIDYGGHLTFYFMAMDDIGGKTHILYNPDLTGYLRVNIDGVHQFYVRGRVSYLKFESGDGFDPTEGDDELQGPRLERAYYHFDLARYLEAYEGQSVDYNLTATGGRQLVHWGNGLVLSKVLDGGVVAGEWGDWRLEGVAGRTYRYQVDFDFTRPDFDDEMDRNFYGGMLSVDIHGHRPYVYGLVQEDENNEHRSPFTGVPAGLDYTYDSHYIGGGITGQIGDRWVYGVEAAYEGGTSTATDSALSQSDEDISAWAVDGKLDYLFNDPHDSRIGGEVLFTSGDDDRTISSTTLFGNTPGTTDHAFNAFGYIQTGLAFNATPSNLWMVRLGGSTFPLKDKEWFHRLQVGMDFFVFGKVDDDAPIDEPTRSDTYLGVEADVYANWQLTSDLAVLLRYGAFFPGDGIVVDQSTKHFFLAGLTFAF